jgi:tight adherence protein B
VPITMAVTFLLVFTLVLVAVATGQKVYESWRSRQVATRLRTIVEPPLPGTPHLLKDPEGKDQPILDRLLAGVDFTRRLDARIRQAGLSWSTGALLVRTAAFGAAGAVLGFLLPVELPPASRAPLLGALVATLPYLYVHRKRRKRLNEIEQQLPEALDFLARSMRAGHAFTMSLEMLGEEMQPPLGTEFRTLFNEQNLGASVELALENLTERVPLLDVRFFASAVMLQRQTGGNLNEILSRLAYIIRERFRLKGQVQAASAHARMTALILTLLPVATTLGLLVIAPDYLRGMAADPDGRHLIIGAIVAQIVGNVVMRQIINIKV